MVPEAHETFDTRLIGRLKVGWWPTWALACAVGAGQSARDGRFGFDLLASWLLGGALFGLFIDQIMAMASGSPATHPDLPGLYAPYTQPGSAADRLSRWLSRQWQAANTRHNGQATALEAGVGALLATATILVLSTYLGPHQTLACAMGLALLAPLALARRRDRTLYGAWPLGVQVGVSWAMGQILGGSSAASTSVSALVVGLTVMGANGGRASRWFGAIAWGAMSAMMLIQRQVWAALLSIALLLAFQCLAPRDRRLRAALTMAMILLFALSLRSASG